MSHREKKLRYLNLIIICLLLGSCSTHKPVALKTELPPAYTTLPTISATKPYAPTSTFTIIPPSSTPTNTWTAISPTSTATLTPVPPTLTPGPTIAPELVQDFLIDLYQNNAGCQLPCWWGFTLGSTSWQEVEAFYERFDSGFVREEYIYSKKHVEIYSSDHSLEGTGIRLWEDFAVKNSILDSIAISGNTVKYDELIIGDPYYNQIFSSYQLSDILSKYGVPENVLVSTFPGAPEGGDIPFYLIVEYSHLGISAKFSGNVRNLGSTFKICPQKVDIKLLLWSVKYSDPAILEVLRDYAFATNLDLREYKSLQSAFNMDLKQFYDLFKTPGNQNCLSTDPEDWDF